MADPPLTELAQFWLGELVALLGTHDGQQYLAEEGIRYPHDLHISDLGMADQELLHLAGGKCSRRRE